MPCPHERKKVPAAKDMSLICNFQYAGRYKKGVKPRVNTENKITVGLQNAHTDKSPHGLNNNCHCFHGRLVLCVLHTIILCHILFRYTYTCTSNQRLHCLFVLGDLIWSWCSVNLNAAS